MRELQEAGVDLFTSGNHVWDKPTGEEVLQEKDPIVLRPANYGTSKSGIGLKEIEIGSKKLLVINLQGEVFMGDEVENPFLYLDTILASHPPKNYNAIFLDFHAEATSEKVALGHYADGRISAFVGTHTHIPTADKKILPGGTAYITDAGMNGAHDSVIGVDKQNIIKRFITGDNKRMEYAETGTCDVNAVLYEIDDDRRATSIELIQMSVET